MRLHNAHHCFMYTLNELFGGKLKYYFILSFQTEALKPNVTKNNPEN
jgi:hypothetical protein